MDDPREILELHGDALYGYAMSRVRDVQVAEDLVQETLLNAIRKLDTFRGEASLRTWLISILRNQISSHFRKANKLGTQVSYEKIPEVDLGGLLDPEVSNSDFRTAIERDEFWTMIQDCYSRIPEHLLQVFLSKTGDGNKSTNELCNDLGISQSNFAVRMFRARLMLRRCIEKRWLDDSK